jgi:hypothetical protein
VDSNGYPTWTTDDSYRPTQRTPSTIYATPKKDDRDAVTNLMGQNTWFFSLTPDTDLHLRQDLSPARLSPFLDCRCNWSLGLDLRVWKLTRSTSAGNFLSFIESLSRNQGAWRHHSPLLPIWMLFSVSIFVLEPKSDSWLWGWAIFYGIFVKNKYCC